MTAPLWAAVPPEVHSVLLFSGPGPGAILAAAAAWTALAREYLGAATELSTLLEVVGGSSWQGSTAERYLAAHAPYLAWLAAQSSNSANTAAQHEVAAAAYTVALATMPTPAELAANHAVHGVLVATNFFGINTIPIALNEADYARMWIQAATTMSTYQAVTQTAVAAIPADSPAPPVIAAAEAQSLAQIWNDILDALAPTILTFPAGQETLDFLRNPLNLIQAFLVDFAANPVVALTTWGPIIFVISYNFWGWPLWWTLYGMLLASPLLMAAAVGLAGLSGLAALAVPEPASVLPDAAGDSLPHQSASNPFPMASIAPITGIAAPATTPTGLTGVGGPSAAPLPGPPAAVPYAVGGMDPDQGVGPTLTDHTAAKAPAADHAAVASATAVSTAAQRRKARRRRAADVKDRGYVYEFLDSDEATPAGPEPTELGATASDRGAGREFGFTGTHHTSGAIEPAGMTELAADSFGNGPPQPLLPTTWTDETHPPR